MSTSFFVSPMLSNGPELIVILVFSNFYVIVLQISWRFAKYKPDGLKNEIDSFVFQKDQLKIDSFDMAALKQESSDQVYDENNDEEFKGENEPEREKLSFPDQKNKETKEGENLNDLWINEEESEESDPSKNKTSHSYQIFEESPRKSPQTEMNATEKQTIFYKINEEDA